MLSSLATLIGWGWNLQSLTDDYDLTRVLSDNMATHSKGGKLDSFWTNLEVTSTVIISELSEISDHSLIAVKLKIGKDVKRTLPHKVYEYFVGSDIRIYLSKDTDARNHLLAENSQETSLRHVIRIAVQKR